MRRGKLLSARRGAVAMMFLLSLCTAGQTMSPPPVSAQPQACPGMMAGLPPVLGLPSLASTFNSYGITANNNMVPPDRPAGSPPVGSGGGFDRNGGTFSQDGLIAAGVGPGALVRSQDVTFTFPNVAVRTQDNTVIDGQTICMSGSGTLGFLLSATYGPSPQTAPATITYTDGSTLTYWLPAIPDWNSPPGVTPTPPTDGATPISVPGPNQPSGTPTGRTTHIFSVTVPLDAGKNLASVQLPPAVPSTPSWPTAVHVFAIGTTTALLSQDRPATASSEESASFPANNAFDGDMGTRWASVASDPQWLRVDLGRVARIDEVGLYWETAYAADFQIQVSMDGFTWTTISTVTGGTGGVWSGEGGGAVGTQILDVANPLAVGRYVRMYGTRRGTGYGYSLWEFQVFGAAAAPVLSPDVSVGYEHACAIVPDRLYCWGDNTNGALGTGSTGGYQSTVVRATTFRTAPVQVSAGYNYTCALNDANLTSCWGNNTSGQLGSPGSSTAVPTPVSGNLSYTQVSASYGKDPHPPGNSHTCALTTDAVAYCWGANNAGQLGNSTNTGSSTPVPVTVPPGVTFNSISAGADHSCAVASNGIAYCWGSNEDGKLGCSAAVNPVCPVSGGSTNAPVAVDTSTGALTVKAVTQVSAGDTHTCAVTSDGNAYCWGDNTYGQLGCDATVTPACPSTAPNYTNVPVAVSFPPGVIRWAQITAGSDFTCALGSNNRAYCWGLGNLGQLGAGSIGAGIPLPMCTAAPSCPVPLPVATGAGTGLPDTDLTQISSGYQTTCAMDDAFHVYCWGSGLQGQLGNGSAATSPVPVATQFPVGELTITVPDQATLATPGIPGGFASGYLGDVTVNDDRVFGAGEWVVAVSATDFTYPPAPSFIIPAANASYSIPGTFTDVEPLGRTPENLASSELALSAPADAAMANMYITGRIHTATWDPAIRVRIPYGAPASGIQGEILHSVY